MCTIACLFRVREDAPLLVAANRDEFYAREARPPELLGEEPRVVAGVDELSGGTWMGMTEGGLFVGITNQRTYQGAEPGLRSRGEVAREALNRGSVAEVEAYLRELDPSAYNSFNLMFGDRGALRVAYARREIGSLRVDALEPGVHVLANDVIGSPEFPKAERAEVAAREAAAMPLDDAIAHLADMLADHALPAPERVPTPPPGSRFDHAFVRRLQALCIHTPEYGTVSSTILAVGRERILRYLYADGRPCESALADVTPLLQSA